MAFTSTDLTNIDAAIASGESIVRFSDGRSVTYRSIAELREARAMVQDSLNQSGTPTIRRISIYTGKGL